MKNIKYSSVVWQEGEHFVAQCLNVEVSSFGNSRDEALLNLREALSLYFEDAVEQKFSPIINAEIINSTLNYA
jgi:predicted RNase H-like HicB family nuclease